MSESQLPPRPVPPRHPVEAVRVWLGWFGPVRLLLTVITVAAVAVGAFWLVRAAPPPVELMLPVASSMPPASTLPPPVGTGPERSSTVPSASLVHVTGAVRNPGVYTLAPDSRIVDAVDAAGGPAPGADLDGINLAAPLADGQRVYVPLAGEIDPATVPSGVGDADPAEGPADPVDVNRASAAELEQLPGVGPATAAAIVDDRERNGPFATIDDLDRVSGIGPAKLDAIRDLVTV